VRLACGEVDPGVGKQRGNGREQFGQPCIVGAGERIFEGVEVDVRLGRRSFVRGTSLISANTVW
jgi:hypothetical protein